MLRVETLLPAAAPGAGSAETVALPYDLRHKVRQRLALNDGTEVALLLARGTVLRDGDVLQAENGRLIRVQAACQPVLLVTAPDSLTLTRAAYHLGNRHTPVEIGTDYLRLEADAVLQDLLIRLGVHVEERHEPFQPESGAYGGGHRHGHEASFTEDHALAQALYHEHAQLHECSPSNPLPQIPSLMTTPARMKPGMCTGVMPDHHTPLTLDILELGALFQLASPGLPVGAFSYSSGLEAAVEHDIVHDVASAQDWIQAGLCEVLGQTEVPLLARLQGAWRDRLHPSAERWNRWHLASRETAELRAETEQMGWSLVKVIEHLAWGSSQDRAQLRVMQPVGFVCAYAFAAAALNLSPAAAATAFCFSWIENQVMAAIKVMPLGQAAGQEILYRLARLVPAVIARAFTVAEDDIISFAPQLGVLSSRHSFQYSRLFRS